MCVCVCVRTRTHTCAPALVMSTRCFFIFDFKTITIRLRSYMPNFNLLLCFKAESMKILRFHIEYMYTILTVVVVNMLL